MFENYCFVNPQSRSGYAWSVISEVCSQEVLDICSTVRDKMGAYIKSSFEHKLEYVNMLLPHRDAAECVRYLGAPKTRCSRTMFCISNLRVMNVWRE